MARNPKGKKEDPQPDSQAPEAQPAGTPQPEAQAPEAPKPEQPIEAEFIGTVQPKYTQGVGTEVQELAKKAETGIGTEAKAVYGLAQRHKLIMAGLAAALVVSVVIALTLNANLQTSNSTVVSLSAQNSALSSQLSNLSDYRTNFSRLRDQVVTLQSALSNKNITIQNLHSDISFLNTELSNSSANAQGLNSTIFGLQQQVHNLTRHVQLGYKDIVLPRSALQIGQGQEYAIRFITWYSGKVVLNVTDAFPFRVTASNKAGPYYILNFPGGSNYNITIPVYGTPTNASTYTVTLVNTGSQSVNNGTIDAILYN